MYVSLPMTVFCSRSRKTSGIRLHTTVRIVANSATNVGNFYAHDNWFYAYLGTNSKFTIVDSSAITKARVMPSLYPLFMQSTR